MNISSVRKDFPVLETQAYLNSAATGPLLSHVKEAVVEWWDAREGLQYFNGLGIDNIEKRVLDLSECLIEGLKDLGLKVNTPYEKEKRAGIVTYTMDRYEDNVRSYEAMKREGIIAAHRYTGGVGGIRISPHVFNTEGEIDRALDIQKKML